jgi:hypothetical protein
MRGTSISPRTKKARKVTAVQYRAKRNHDNEKNNGQAIFIRFRTSAFGGIPMGSNTTTTTRKIGKTTYLVTASSSENATDTLEGKIEKLIIKALQRNAGKPDVSANFSQ